MSDVIPRPLRGTVSKDTVIKASRTLSWLQQLGFDTIATCTQACCSADKESLDRGAEVVIQQQSTHAAVSSSRESDDKIDVPACVAQRMHSMHVETNSLWIEVPTEDHASPLASPGGSPPGSPLQSPRGTSFHPVRGTTYHLAPLPTADTRPVSPYIAHQCNSSSTSSSISTKPKPITEEQLREIFDSHIDDLIPFLNFGRNWDRFLKLFRRIHGPPSESGTYVLLTREEQLREVFLSRGFKMDWDKFLAFYSTMFGPVQKDWTSKRAGEEGEQNEDVSGEMQIGSGKTELAEVFLSGLHHSLRDHGPWPVNHGPYGDISDEPMEPMDGNGLACLDCLAFDFPIACERQSVRDMNMLPHVSHSQSKSSKCWGMCSSCSKPISHPQTEEVIHQKVVNPGFVDI